MSKLLSSLQSPCKCNNKKIKNISLNTTWRIQIEICYHSNNNNNKRDCGLFTIDKPAVTDKGVRPNKTLIVLYFRQIVTYPSNRNDLCEVVQQAFLIRIFHERAFLTFYLTLFHFDSLLPLEVTPNWFQVYSSCPDSSCMLHLHFSGNIRLSSQNRKKKVLCFVFIFAFTSLCFVVLDTCRMFTDVKQKGYKFKMRLQFTGTLACLSDKANESAAQVITRLGCCCGEHRAILLLSRKDLISGQLAVNHRREGFESGENVTLQVK